MPVEPPIPAASGRSECHSSGIWTRSGLITRNKTQGTRSSRPTGGGSIGRNMEGARISETRRVSAMEYVASLRIWWSL